MDAGDDDDDGDDDDGVVVHGDCGDAYDAYDGGYDEIVCAAGCLVELIGGDGEVERAVSSRYGGMRADSGVYSLLLLLPPHTTARLLLL